MNDDPAVAAPAPAAMNDNDGVLDEVLRRRDETLVNRERRGFRRTRLQSQPKRGHCGGAEQGSQHRAAINSCHWRPPSTNSRTKPKG
jgi:hypothetical protein